MKEAPDGPFIVHVVDMWDFTKTKAIIESPYKPVKGDHLIIDRVEYEISHVSQQDDYWVVRILLTSWDISSLSDEEQDALFRLMEKGGIVKH